MKTFLPVILSILILAISSCTSRSGKEAGLDRAETLVDSLPTEALAILDSIAVDSTDPASIRARHALLTSRGLYKSMQEVPDSLVDIALAYYKNTDNYEYKMHSFLIRGSIRTNQNRLSAAATDFLEAKEYAERIDDHLSLGMIYRFLDIVYSRARNYEEALGYSKQAVDELSFVSDSSYVKEAIMEYVTTLNNAGYSHIAESVFNCNKGILSNDSFLADRYNQLEAYIFICNHKYDDALSLLNSIPLKDSLDFFNLVNISTNIGRMDIADSIVDNFGESFNVPAEYWVRKGNFEEAWNSSEKELKCQSDFFSTLSESDFTTTLTNYYQSKRDEEIAVAHHQRMVFMIIILVFVILLLSAIIGIKALNQNKKKIEDEFISSIMKLSEEVVSKQKLFERENQRIRIQSHLEGRISELDNLCREYYMFYSSRDSQKKIAERLEKLVESLSSDSNMIKEIETLTNMINDNLFEKFKADFPDLKPIDYRLFLYKIVGFSVSSISLFMKEDPKNLHNRRYRIKQKIEKSTVPMRETYLKILSTKAK